MNEFKNPRSFPPSAERPGQRATNANLSALPGFKSISGAARSVLGTALSAMMGRRNDIHRRVHDCIRAILPNVGERDLVDAASFFEHFGCDELDKLNVAMKVELEFGISLSDSDLEAFQTVRDLVALVERKTIEKAKDRENG